MDTPTQAGGQHPRASTDLVARERVLARRRTALIGLGLGAVVTLAAAIVTGSWALLVISLLVDVALAAYIALLLQIKQTRAFEGNLTGATPRSPDDEVRVVG